MTGRPMRGTERRLPAGYGYLVEGPLAGGWWPVWCENWAGDKALVGAWESVRWVSKTWVSWARRADGAQWEFFYASRRAMRRWDNGRAAAFAAIDAFAVCAATACRTVVRGDTGTGLAEVRC